MSEISFRVETDIQGCLGEKCPVMKRYAEKANSLMPGAKIIVVKCALYGLGPFVSTHAEAIGVEKHLRFKRASTLDHKDVSVPFWKNYESHAETDTGIENCPAL